MIQAPCTVGDWGVLIPVASGNRAKNPSAETTGNYAARNAATVTRSTTYQWRGLYCYSIVSAANDEGIELTLETLANSVHFVTVPNRGRLPDTWQWSLNNATWRKPKLLRTDNGWMFHGIVFPASEANGSTTLYIRQSGAGSFAYYADAIQVEPLSYPTTYIDGDEDDCKWTGAPHASASTRSSQVRSGGVLRQLNTYYNVNVETVSGIGLVDSVHNVQESAVQPGAILQSVKDQPRSFMISCEPPATKRREMHQIRQGLVNAFKHNLVTPLQPVSMHYTAGRKTLRIAATYDQGLGVQWEKFMPEKISLSFVAYDPYFYELPQGAASLATGTSVADADYVAKRIDGVWSNISTQFNGTVFAFAMGPDGSMYIGGAFDSVGDANGDYIVKVAPDGTISSLGTGMDAPVYAIAVAPNGDVYAGGSFSLAGGVANTAHIAVWRAGAWVPLLTGVNDIVRALLFGIDGLLYVGGDFLNAGDANGDHIVKWDPAAGAWASMGTGTNGNVYAIVSDSLGNIYIGGAFALAGGVADTLKIAKWNVATSVWMPLSTGMGNNVNALVMSANGGLYAGGGFTTAGGVAANRIARWNGTWWEPLGSGMNGSVYSLAMSGSTLVAGGAFTTAGGLGLADKVAVWNGTDWAWIDADLPTTATVYSMFSTGNALYLGYSIFGTLTVASATTVTNGGSTDAYPQLIIKRSGGTSAVVQWLKNETNGKIVYFNYSLQDGETLTIDFVAKTIVSSSYGNVIGRALLPGGDFSTWCLQNGANDVFLRVSNAGAATVTAHFLWYNTHSSADL